MSECWQTHFGIIVKEPILAWHFVGATLRDGRPVPKDGKLLKFDGIPVICERGLHASIHPFDALTYAPGSTICRVKCAGTVVHEEDKLACTERTIVARADATEMLRYFARMQALSVLDNYPNPSDAVLDWLMTGEEDVRSAACNATRRAIWHAGANVAHSAIQSAFWSTLWSTAPTGAVSAAFNAVRNAAYSSAWNPTVTGNISPRRAARDLLLQLVEEGFSR